MDVKEYMDAKQIRNQGNARIWSNQEPVKEYTCKETTREYMSHVLSNCQLHTLKKEKKHEIVTRRYTNTKHKETLQQAYCDLN